MPIIGLGTDIVQISRFEQMDDTGDKRDRLAQRVLTSCEFDIYQQHAHPARFLAKRFAVKEAAVKALGTGIGQGVGWQHLSVTHTDIGQPLLQYTDGFADIASELGVTHSHVSISDEKEYAVATVILEAHI